MQPVIPTLSKGSRDLLDDPKSIVLYLLSHAISSPGGTSNLYENEVLSLRKMIAAFSRDPQALASIFQTQFQRVLNKYFPNGGYTVIAEPELIKDGVYKLLVHVQGPEGTLLNINDVIVNGDSITIDYGSK